MCAMKSSDYLHLLKTENARLSQVDEANLNDPIPHVDGWTVQDVVGHTGWIARYVTAVIATDPDNPPSRSDVPEPPPGPEVLEWFAAGGSALVHALESADPDHIAPSFTGPQPVSWWIRRMAHEFSMHRWDAFSASASPDAISADLAVDGIDETLSVFVPNRLEFGELAGNGETIHLHASDVDDGEWLLHLGAGEVTWEKSHAKADVAARGPVSDLLLMIWSRIPPSRLEVFGDASILDRWQQAASF
jgi:uncharacterized protein (TIGR03083 family)